MAKRSKFNRDSEKAETIVMTTIQALVLSGTPQIHVFGALIRALAVVIASQEPKITAELLKTCLDVLPQDVATIAAAMTYPSEIH